MSEQNDRRAEIARLWALRDAGGEAEGSTSILWYVEAHYGHLMAPPERRASQYLFHKDKTRTEERLKKRLAMLQERGELIDTEETRELLADGPRAFWDRVVARILRQHGDDVFLNTCSECGALMRTPRARQCLLCGHDWH